VRPVGAMYRADALPRTSGRGQRWRAWARHIKPSGVWGASVLAGDYLSRAVFPITEHFGW